VIELLLLRMMNNRAGVIPAFATGHRQQLARLWGGAYMYRVDLLSCERDTGPVHGPPVHT
jgi:hypothetical protein